MKTKMLIICALLIMALSLTIFVGCDVEENGIEDGGDDMGDGFGFMNDAEDADVPLDVLQDTPLEVA